MIENLSRAARYRAQKGTARFERKQAALRRKAIAAIEGMRHPVTGQRYTRERAERAVSDYAASAKDTSMGPDWPGFVRLVANHGLIG